ncbi:AEC family transporter [Anabaena azotica]|uniref:AEC family transporter n=1 Tax=Anabaena azotica FACHB-119 TaxID=947527 RepID=A0ABR8DBJ1_9NOST|nr:AEC family transporter [Anabaena azotica]MBD2503833.1 AEC family transporter [Anabaena azotica FACHB-119]
MTETLVQAYTPLILWIGLGLLLFRLLPQWLPHFLGRSLYWVGVPLQLIALARRGNQNELSGTVEIPILASLITFGALFLGLVVALLVWWGWQQISPYLFKSELSESVSHPLQDSSSKGSFLLAAVLGNTGFVGLAIAPYLVHVDALNWVVLFSITHNVIGPYGLGVLIASYFSHTKSTNQWWMLLWDLLTVPPLWAFLIGTLTQHLKLPAVVESGLQSSVDVVIACAFLLIGIRLAQLQGWQSLQLALIPSVLRVVIIPLLVGLLTTLLLGLGGDRRLAMVLMSGMPSAFAGLILAEEYNLNRDLIAGSIILSTLLLLLILPVWIQVFS